jgi:hypothetical protein
MSPAKQPSGDRHKAISWVVGRLLRGTRFALGVRNMHYRALRKARVCRGFSRSVYIVLANGRPPWTPKLAGSLASECRSTCKDEFPASSCRMLRHTAPPAAPQRYRGQTPGDQSSRCAAESTPLFQPAR